MKFAVDRRILREYVRFFINNAWRPSACSRFSPALIRRAHEFGYVHWPKHLERHVKYRDVLDVGCGMGLHGVGFVLSGVRSYTGCDPIVDLDSDIVKNTRPVRREPCGWTPRAMMHTFPQLLYVKGTLENLPPGRRWDVVTLHNTTEHLIDIEGIFASIARLLRPRGLLIFSHHNYYCWNGHHMAPKNVSAIDRSDPNQQKVIDWAHLEPDAELRSYLSTRVNTITLDGLRQVTEREFEIAEWQEKLSNAEQGGSRLTDDIQRRHPNLTSRDFRTQTVYCVARARV